jgi:hypothetical protein
MVESSSAGVEGAYGVADIGVGLELGGAIELVEGGRISDKMRSHYALCHVFTSTPIVEVSGVKSVKSSFLFFAATFVLRSPILTSCFSNIIVYLVSYFSSLKTAFVMTPAIHFKRHDC